MGAKASFVVRILSIYNQESSHSIHVLLSPQSQLNDREEQQEGGEKDQKENKEKQDVKILMSSRCMLSWFVRSCFNIILHLSFTSRDLDILIYHQKEKETQNKLNVVSEDTE